MKNRDKNGRFIKGHKQTKKIKKIISIKNTGKKRSDNFKKFCGDLHRGMKHSKETKEIISKKNSGENNYRYIKDRTLLKKSENKMSDCAYKEWSHLVKKRDYGKCKLLNSDCKGRL